MGTRGTRTTCNAPTANLDVQILTIAYTVSMMKLAYTTGVRRALEKLGLYTTWSREEPALKQIGTEDQSAGLAPGHSSQREEPYRTDDPREEAKAMKRQFNSGQDVAPGMRTHP